MKRTTLLVGLLLFAVVWTWLMGLGVAGTSPTGAQPDIDIDAEIAPVDGTGARITYVDDTQFPNITVYLAVNDEDGNPGLGLRQNNFTLKEDGEEVPIIDFIAAGGQAATVLLVIDHSGSMDDAGKMAGARQAASTFIKQLQSGQDQVGVIVFDDRIETLAPLDTITDAQKQALQQQIGQIQPRGYTQFYRTVQEAIDQLSENSGRKVVVALTDGNDDNGRALLEETIVRAAGANVPIYTIGLGSDVDEGGLKPLAEQSGGAYYFSPNADELEALYQEIGSNLRNEYALVYESSTPNLDGTRRDLAVDVQSGGSQLSTEGGYQVGGIIASSLNWTLFLPLFGGLLVGLIGLYKLPALRRRGSETDEAIPVAAPIEATEAVSSTPSPVSSQQPTVTVPVMPTVPVNDVPSASLNARYPFVSGENLVGSGADCTIALSHPSVDARHARITPMDDRYVLEDLSGGRSLVSYSGDPAQLRQVERNALKDGSLLRLGEAEMIFRQKGTDAWLEQVYILSSTEITIGSAPSCDIVIANVAPQQARISQEDGRWVVTNLASNGLFVSYSGDPAMAQPVSGRNALKDGSLLQVGTVQLIVDNG